MSFDAHGAVQGAPATQPVMSSIPAATPAPEAAPAPAAAPASQSSPNPSTVGSQNSPAHTGEPGTPDPKPWEPNFKFKVMDKEHEIDEFVRGAIKDQETEKKIKELYEKAYGLDVVKPRFHETREAYKSLQETHQGVMGGIQELRELYQAGDFDNFFARMKIPTEKVLQWVIDKAQYNELPPEQRQVLDARKQAEREALELRKQNQSLNQQYEEAVVQARDTQLQVALAKPDVKAFSEAFDSKGFKTAAGKPVTFWDAVVEAGETAWYASKGRVDLTPEQAIQEVMARYGAAIMPQQPAPAPVIPVQGTTPAAQAAAAQKKVPTLPNVAGRQQSSVGKAKPKSLEDLKKLAAGMSS